MIGSRSLYIQFFRGAGAQSNVIGGSALAVYAGGNIPAVHQHFGACVHLKDYRIILLEYFLAFSLGGDKLKLGDGNIEYQRSLESQFGFLTVGLPVSVGKVGAVNVFKGRAGVY